MRNLIAIIVSTKPSLKAYLNEYLPDRENSNLPLYLKVSLVQLQMEKFRRVVITDISPDLSLSGAR